MALSNQLVYLNQSLQSAIVHSVLSRLYRVFPKAGGLCRTRYVVEYGYPMAI